jgi:hypothetical protein
MAGRACHAVCSATRVGLIQALGGLCNLFVLSSSRRQASQASAAPRAKRAFGKMALAPRHPSPSPRTVYAPATARLAAHPAPAATRPGHSAPGVGRSSHRLSLSWLGRASNELPIAVAFALAALRPLARRLTSHSSRTRIATPSIWQIKLAIWPSQRCKSA